MAKKRVEEESTENTQTQPTPAELKRALTAVRNSLAKKWGTEVFADSTPKDLPVFSTGSALVDKTIGIGGLARGRVHEIFGEPSAGKTTFTSCLMAEAQKAEPDQFAAFVDVEQAYNTKYAMSLGVNISEDRLLFSQPGSAEEALDVVLSLAESGVCSIIVLDSVAALQTKRQLEGEVGKETMGELARIMSQTLPKIVRAAARSNTLVIFINQIRDKMVMYGSPETTSGGKALPFYCSTRLRIRRSDIVMDGDTPIGQEVEVKVVKNKTGDPFGVVKTNILFNKGFDPILEVTEVAIEKGIIERSGAWYYIFRDTDDELKFQGKQSVLDEFNADRSLYNKIHQLVEESYRPAVVQTEDEDGYGG